MKFKALISTIFSLFVFCSSIAQKPHKSDETYLKEGAEILNDFYAFDENNTYPYKFQLNFFKKYNTKNMCCGKRKVINYRNHNSVKRYVNAFERLPEKDKAFFKKINDLTQEADNAKALYYKIMNYWLLPCQVSRRFTEYSDLRENSGCNFTWQTEQRFDESVLLFLAKEEHLEKFNNFEELVKTTNQAAQDFINSEKKIRKINHCKGSLTGFPDLLYVRSKSMIELIEKLRGFQK